MSNKHRGTSLDSFLEEQGTFEESQVLAIKEVLVWQVTEAMERQAEAERQAREQRAAAARQAQEAYDRCVAEGRPGCPSPYGVEGFYYPPVAVVPPRHRRRSRCCRSPSAR